MTEKLADALQKFAFIESLPTFTGLAAGYGPGREAAGQIAAEVAPKGRVHRSERIARNAAVIGAPLGGLAAMALAKHYGLAPGLAARVAKRFPTGLIAEPGVEQELVHLGIPGAAAIGGSIVGGGLTGAAVGGLQRLRGALHPHHEKAASLKPSPMWSRIGGASSKKPVWMAQSGFTPTGFKTPAQRLSKSMDMGTVDGSAGLKPLNLGKMQQQAQEAVKMGEVMLAITKTATGQRIPKRSEKDPRRHLADNAKMMGGLGVSQVGGVGNGLLIDSLGQQVHAESAADAGGALFQRVHGSSPVPVVDLGKFPGTPTAYAPANVREIEQLYKLNPQLKTPEGFKPLSPHVLLGEHRSPSVLAHEIGHAEFDTTRAGRLLQHPGLGRVLNHVKVPGAIALGAAGGFSDDPRIQAAALAGGVALHTPTLINEGAANINAYRRLKRLGASAEELGRARGSLGRAMGTYGTAALAPIGLGLLGQGIVHRLRHRDEDKTATVRDPIASEKEDAETGDETEPGIAKAADDGGQGGFSTNQYSGVMNPPAMKYQSGIPPWQEPPVKAAGPPPEDKIAFSLRPELSPMDQEYYSGEPLSAAWRQANSDPGVQQAHKDHNRDVNVGAALGAISGGILGHHLGGHPIIGALGGTLLGAGAGSSLKAETVRDARRQAYQDALDAGVPGPVQKTAAGITPLGRLNSAKAIGAPRSTAAPGPSIAQIAKPKGFGMPMSGAKKGNNII